MTENESWLITAACSLDLESRDPEEYHMRTFVAAREAVLKERLGPDHEAYIAQLKKPRLKLVKP